jgi:hypothetical protein
VHPMVRSRSGPVLAVLSGIAVFLAALLSLAGVSPSFAVQDPTISFDMVPAGNAYTGSAGQPETLGPSANPWIAEPGNQCGLVAPGGPANTADEDSDGVVNDGCPAVGALTGAETGAQCLNSVDDDLLDDISDPDPNNPHTVGLVNDGCPSVGIVGNTMALGAIDPCSSSPAPGNNSTHLLTTHLVVQNVENLIGWQARVNYDGGKMRPSAVNFTPFADAGLGQNISFVNLPIDAQTGAHRGVVGAMNIPAQSPGPQTASFGSTYLSSQNAPISPDTPYINDEPTKSYEASGGGVLANVTLQVLAGNAGQSMSVDLDDGDPNAPGSGVAIFTADGVQAIYLGEGSLGDGTHDEGLPCPAPAPSPTPTLTATPSPSPTPSPTASSTATPTPSPTANASTGKVTGGGQLLGDPIFSPDGQLLSAPAVIARLPSGLESKFGFVVQAGQPPAGNLTYHDDFDGTDVKATSFSGLSFTDGGCGAGTHATFNGTAIVNGEAGKAFRVEADDCGEPGVGSDRFAIEILEPNGYSNAGTLIGGNVQIHY